MLYFFLAAVHQHFQKLHTDGHFGTQFIVKNIGDQVGRICQVTSGNSVTVYFIKTHQYGPNKNMITSSENPDARELLVYMCLEFMDIGPSVHFILTVHGSKKTVYICTEKVDIMLLKSISE